ncbi:MAG: putative pyridine nucleotide-disulfide oxidoreductase YkgC [Chloroflexota bacterium]
MAAAQYDAEVIVSGQAGGSLARAFADAGWRVAVVEREHAGGTCINEGCTPTKTIVASARSGHLIRRANMPEVGGATTEGRLVPYTALRDAVFAHLTLAEALNSLFAKIEA